MPGFFKQCSALSMTNLRSLRRRKLISLSMVLSVALVVVVLLGFLSMANGFRKTLAATGAADVVLVTSQGSFSETTSRLTTEQLHLLAEAPGIARDDMGRPMVSPELLVPVDARRQSDGQSAPLSLRGVGAKALVLRPTLSISKGRVFTPGTDEIIVGARLAARYQAMQIGDTITFGQSKWTVVGHFTAGGSVFDSEMLADIEQLRAMFNRQGQVQSLRVRLSDPANFAAFQTYVEGLDMGLRAATEKDYYSAQSHDLSQIILFIGWPLAVVMAVGAAVGAMTTMYSSVSDRLVEIATQRAIGFSRSAAFVGTLIEVLALTVLGCVIGVVIAWLGLDGWSASTRSGASTQLSFELALSLPIIVNAALLALCVGLIGGGLPAFRATRVPLRSAMTGRST